MLPCVFPCTLTPLYPYTLIPLYSYTLILFYAYTLISLYAYTPIPLYAYIVMSGSWSPEELLIIKLLVTHNTKKYHRSLATELRQ